MATTINSKTQIIHHSCHGFKVSTLTAQHLCPILSAEDRSWLDTSLPRKWRSVATSRAQGPKRMGRFHQWGASQMDGYDLGVPLFIKSCGNHQLMNSYGVTSLNRSQAPCTAWPGDSKCPGPRCSTSMDNEDPWRSVSEQQILYVFAIPFYVLLCDIALLLWQEM